ncbi:MAG: GTPase HflX [Deltaproteobacteria bacterium]|nr:GTPase HflX [Deltaproteobacteria bacterium]
MRQVSGNLTGLKPSELSLLERIYRRRVPPHEIITQELGSFLCEVSSELGRQVGVMITRRGDIEHVVVGDASKLMLPDVGRLRGAVGRFRGVRLVHTHLRGEALTRDDLTDLALLRLDLVAAITIEHGNRPGKVHAAHLTPPNEHGEMFMHLPSVLLRDLSVDFDAMIRALEGEFARRTPAATVADRGKPRAMIVSVQTGRRPGDGSTGAGGVRRAAAIADGEARVAELRELARTAGVVVVDVVTQYRPQPDPRFMVGAGKLDDVVTRAMQLGADLLVFDPDLTPGQARAISDRTEIKVIDRTMLILDIFAQRATSADGKLQVELAQLKYTLPRLVEKNTMMSRLTGGIGGRGPGETKLEINRRRARERIQRLEKQIESLSKQRGLRRERRTTRNLPIVSIVGYTNAGKSTLLNTLTDGQVLVEDKLFATLDPASRRLRFPREREVILTDTVGFIRELPRDLVNAFRATLEELGDSDLLLHVVDGADPDHVQHIRAVERILEELELHDKPRVLIFNKSDLGPGVADAAADASAFAISAQDASTLSRVLGEIETRLWHKPQVGGMTRDAALME